MNKKGIAIELFTILIVLFVLIISVMFTFQFVKQFQSNEIVTSSGLNMNITQYGVDAIKSFDSIIIFLLIVFTIWVIVASFYIQTNPIFFVIGVLGLIPIIIMSGYLSNMYNSFVDTGNFNDFTQNFTTIPSLMERLPYFILIIGVLIIIALYAKDRIMRSLI